MAAYVIVDVDLQNLEALEQYRQRVIPIVQSFGGRYLVAGPDGDALEGSWRPRTMAIIEFPSMEQARRGGPPTPSARSSRSGTGPVRRTW